MSKTLRYVGIHEDVFVPALNDAYVEQGGTVVVEDDALAANLLEQDSWEDAAPSAAADSGRPADSDPAAESDL